MNRYICIHGHFYQPPRENPWLEEIELQDSAYPYHDWNQRITSECYFPNVASRILDADKHIVDIVNNYKKISFNFGPTLLSWMERNSPELYKDILKADKDSCALFSGHGSAIAQAYNHMIMPLANSRDKHTQVIWGIKDFESRFQRKPEGIWLPETAVDTDTLEVLVDHGIKFTILAPGQARGLRKIGEKRWKSVKNAKIDPRRSYICHLPSGRSINLFFYDGPIAQDIAFGDLLKNGLNLANRFTGAFSASHPEDNFVHVATDGETYGHHHLYGDMALSYCLDSIDKGDFAKLTIYGEYLEKHPPEYEVRIYENTSWSCAHGVERWKSDCGCCINPGSGMHQKWREPLRKALDWLRDALVPIYEKEMSSFSSDPWEIRNRYIDVVLDRSDESVKKFIREITGKDLSDDEKVRFLKTLEMQRHTMLMYTSCGWFFDEISGIETTQILCYAARAIQLAKQISGCDLEQDFINIIEQAPSNNRKYSTGAGVYEKCVKPDIIDLARVGAHFAVSSLFEQYTKYTQIYSYAASIQIYDRLENGKHRLAIGKVPIRSEITHEQEVISFAVLHLGGHSLIGGAHQFQDEKTFSRMHQEIKDAFKRSDESKTIKLIKKHFESNHYSLVHLFKDEQSKVLYQVLDSTLEKIEESLRKIHEYHSSIIQVVKQLKIPLPKVLANTVLVMLNKDLVKALGSDIPDFNRLKLLVDEVVGWSLEIDKVTVGFVAKNKINGFMEVLKQKPDSMSTIEHVVKLLKMIEPLELDIDLWRAQNIYFALGKKMFVSMTEKAGRGDKTAKAWVAAFSQLGDYLKVKVG